MPALAIGIERQHSGVLVIDKVIVLVLCVTILVAREIFGIKRAVIFYFYIILGTLDRVIDVFQAELQGVFSRLKAQDLVEAVGRLGYPAEHDGVFAPAANKLVVAFATDEGVVALVANQLVIAFAPVEKVVAPAALKRVVALGACYVFVKMLLVVIGITVVVFPILIFPLAVLATAPVIILFLLAVLVVLPVVIFVLGVLVVLPVSVLPVVIFVLGVLVVLPVFVLVAALMIVLFAMNQRREI